MDYADLLFEIRDGVAIVTLHAPERRNTISLKMRKSLTAAMGDIAENDEIKVVVLTGTGDIFSAGGDIKLMKDRISGTLEETRYERLQRVGYWGDLLPRLDKPIIAAVNGPAIGAGFSLVMSSDIRIASEKAQFGSVFIHRALVPDCGLTYYLPRAVGASKALELMLSGRMVGAEEARTLGLISQIVPQAELTKTALDLAAKIAGQPPIAVALTKRLVYRAMVDDVARQLDLETYAQQLCFGTEDFRDRAVAFLEKRPNPPPKGK